MHTPSRWHYWWDPIVLAQLQVLTGLVGGVLALLALVYAWRVARRQFQMMEEQGVIVSRQSELLEEQAATSTRIEEITKRQGDIAETQHKIMLEQRAKRPDLVMFLRGSQPHIVEIGGNVVSVSFRYLVSVHNRGNKTAENVTWRVFLEADDRLNFGDAPAQFDMDNKLEYEGLPVYKAEGTLSDPVLTGGMRDVFEITVHNHGRWGVVRPEMKWMLRCEDGRFPTEGDGTINFDRVGLPDAAQAAVS